MHYKVNRLNFHMARKLGVGPLVNAENRKAALYAQRNYDVIWIEKGIFLHKTTIIDLVKQCKALIHFTPDPGFHFHTLTRHFLNCLPYYDVCGTTKPSDLDLYARNGVKHVVLCSKSYNPSIHRVYPEGELEPFRSDATFAGTWTPLKQAVLRKVVDALPGAVVRIWGGEWRRKCRDRNLLERHSGPLLGILGEDYGRALAGAKIGLGLLSTDVYPDEVITDRILEIPACGAMLVAPRTAEIETIFRDGQEALLFGSDQELLDKLRWALDHEAERQAIAARGHERVIAGAYRDQDVVARLLEEAMASAQRETP